MPDLPDIDKCSNTDFHKWLKNAERSNSEFIKRHEKIITDAYEYVKKNRRNIDPENGHVNDKFSIMRNHILSNYPNYKSDDPIFDGTQESNKSLELLYNFITISNTDKTII